MAILCISGIDTAAIHMPRRGRPLNRLRLDFSLAILALAFAGMAHADVCRVTTSGTATDTGATWAASMDLQTALATDTCTEIWVATGTYTPTVPNGDRHISFEIRPNVAVYGGFAGTETSRNQRNPAAYITTLSGDLNGDDGPDFANNSDNSYHVVFLESTTAAGPIATSTMIDGFTISGGNADGMTPPDDAGGGLYCRNGGENADCSPSLNNITFRGNRAGRGGAMFNENFGTSGNSPNLTNVIFRANHADTDGGAMYNRGGYAGHSTPNLTNVIFSDNTADRSGGAMYNVGLSGGHSSPRLDHVTFSGNTAGSDGGAIYSYGESGTSNPKLNNVTFSGNVAGSDGGAMYNASFNGASNSPSLVNVTFSGNTAGGRGGAMHNNGSAGGNSTPSLSNVILWGDSATGGSPEIHNNVAQTTIRYSVIQGSGGSGNWDSDLGNDGGGNLDADPMLGPLADYGGTLPTMLPGAGSAAIDTGDDALCPATDQRGLARPQNQHCDIGAAEVAQVVELIAMAGYGQDIPVWQNFTNPLVVQVAGPGWDVAPGTRLQVTAPGGPGQPGATCSDAFSNTAGLAFLYCRANGVAGTYSVEVHAQGWPAVAPAVFVLTNAPDDDRIFMDGFDLPGPHTLFAEPRHSAVE